MSNQIFCKVNKEMCDAVKAIAGDRIVVDCGAGRGLFASMYDGKVLSIDIHQPDEPLSFIIEKNAEHYCFPRNSIPIFIRPCHSNFVHNTILKNRNKFDKAIYVSLPKNLDGDLDDRVSCEHLPADGLCILATIPDDSSICGMPECVCPAELFFSSVKSQEAITPQEFKAISI
jgi:hypothetical protein